MIAIWFKSPSMGYKKGAVTLLSRALKRSARSTLPAKYSSAGRQHRRDIRDMLAKFTEVISGGEPDELLSAFQSKEDWKHRDVASGMECSKLLLSIPLEKVASVFNLASASAIDRKGKRAAKRALAALVVRDFEYDELVKHGFTTLSKRMFTNVREAGPFRSYEQVGRKPISVALQEEYSKQWEHHGKACPEWASGFRATELQPAFVVTRPLTVIASDILAEVTKPENRVKFGDQEHGFSVGTILNYRPCTVVPARRATDLCTSCEALRKLKSQERGIIGRLAVEFPAQAAECGTDLNLWVRCAVVPVMRRIRLTMLLDGEEVLLQHQMNAARQAAAKTALISSIKEEKQRAFFILYDFAANAEVGKSERELGEAWFDRISNGLSMLGVYVIGTGMQEGVFFCALSESHEHTSRAAVAVLRKVEELCSTLEQTKESFKEATSVHYWSDCGPHFMSYETNYHVLSGQSLKRLGCKVEEVYDSFFVKQHGKTAEVDGRFGMIKSHLERASMDTPIEGITDVQNLLKDFAGFEVFQYTQEDVSSAIHPRKKMVYKGSFPGIQKTYCIRSKIHKGAGANFEVENCGFSDVAAGVAAKYSVVDITDAPQPAESSRIVATERSPKLASLRAENEALARVSRGPGPVAPVNAPARSDIIKGLALSAHVALPAAKKQATASAKQLCDTKPVIVYESESTGGYSVGVILTVMTSDEVDSERARWGNVRLGFGSNADVHYWLEYFDGAGDSACTGVARDDIVRAAVERRLYFIKPEFASTFRADVMLPVSGENDWVRCSECNLWRVCKDPEIFKHLNNEHTPFRCSDLGGGVTCEVHTDADEARYLPLPK